MRQLHRLVRDRVVRLLLVVTAALFGCTGSAAAASYTQTIDPGHSLKAISCMPATTTCVVANSQGDSMYATDVSASSAATWNPWSGPTGQSPSHAVECPASTLCVLAAGEVEGGGGNLYRATSLGGPFLTSVLPANGFNAVSCPSTSFCVAANNGGGFIRYSTNPSGIIWSAVSIGTGAMKDVSCLSSSFCAVVDGASNIHVAATEEGVKESAGWVVTNLNGAAGLRSIACISTTSCLAVDGSNEVLSVTIAADGKATSSKVVVDGAGELVAVSCTGETCVAADGVGALFSSTNGGADWAMRYGSGAPATSASCPTSTLCAGISTSGTITTFDPSSVMPPRVVITTNALPDGAAKVPYAAQLEATEGTPPYRWSATGLPLGLTIDKTSGRITGTPMTAICVQAPCAQPPVTYTPTITVADSDGIPSSKQLTLAIAGAAAEIPPGRENPPGRGTAAPTPVVTDLKASHRLWRLGSGLARISKARGNGKTLPVGTTFSFNLNMPATVEFHFQRHIQGRKRGDRCVVQTSKNRQGEPCRRSAQEGLLSFASHPGANRVVFKGRLSRTDALKPGHYTLVVTTTGSDGQRSAPAWINFRMVK
jgi:Putative Ig domain